MDYEVFGKLYLYALMGIVVWGIANANITTGILRRERKGNPQAQGLYASTVAMVLNGVSLLILLAAALVNPASPDCQQNIGPWAWLISIAFFGSASGLTYAQHKTRSILVGSHL